MTGKEDSFKIGPVFKATTNSACSPFYANATQDEYGDDYTYRQELYADGGPGYQGFVVDIYKCGEPELDKFEIGREW